MSAHYDSVDHTRLEFHQAGDWVGYDEIADGHYAFVIGDPSEAAGVIEGTREELFHLAHRMITLLQLAS